MSSRKARGRPRRKEARADEGNQRVDLREVQGVEELERRFLDTGLLRMEVIADGSAAEETPEELLEQLDVLRAEARRRGHRLGFDAVSEVEELDRPDQEVLWALLRARAQGFDYPSAAELIDFLAKRPSERLLYAHTLGERGATIAAGIVEHDGDEHFGQRCFRLTEAAFEVLAGCEVQPEEEAGGEAADEPARVPMPSYQHFLDLLLRLAVARVEASAPAEGADAEPWDPPLLRRRRRLRDAFIDSVDEATGHKAAAHKAEGELAELEAAVELELSSGRWAGSPLARLAEEHGFDSTDLLALVHLALDAHPPEDDDDPEQNPFEQQQSRGLPGGLLIQVLATDRPGQMRERRRLYADAPLRRSGLVLTFGSRHDVPELLCFGVPERVVRQILGHDDAPVLPSTTATTGSGGSAAVLLVAPKATLADVVLPDAVRERIGVDLLTAGPGTSSHYGIEGGLASGSGLTFVFTGPSGTGKTLCAEAIAGELELPLLLVDVPRLMSKWVGETQKNIAEVFRHAAREPGVLLFDEADSLFGDRQVATHGWEVRDVNVLLTEIERHDGVVVLTTNRRDALDTALCRRVATTIDFPKPDAAARTAIWRAHLSGSKKLSDDVDVEALGRDLELTGGEIANAVRLAARIAWSRSAKLLDHEALVEAASSVARGRWGDAARAPIGFGRAGTNRRNART